eukprot:3561930-Ditylum_brightwellii.AAC.1
MKSKDYCDAMVKSEVPIQSRLLDAVLHLASVNIANSPTIEDKAKEDYTVILRDRDIQWDENSAMNEELIEPAQLL